MGEHDTMNRYRTKLFDAQRLDGEHAGEFVDCKDYEDLNDWIQGEVEEGCTLKSIQPVAYDGSLYVLATMELVDLDMPGPIK